MPTGFTQQDFTINVYQPLPQGGAFLNSLTVPLAAWQHRTASYGGYDQASFRLEISLEEQEDWLENGLGRPIVAHDEAHGEFWSGFVNQVTLSKAGLEVTRGPLDQIATRVIAIFSSIDTSTTPPTPGVRKKTTQATNALAETLYGIWPRISSMAGATDSNADQLRDRYLQEHRLPETSSNYNYGGQSISISIQCRGWIHSLQYPYSQTTTSGTIAVSEQIKNILTADPNGWVSGDHSRIVSNTTPVPRWDSSDGKAMDTIKGLVALGDSSLNRYLFGIYENRQPVYEAASSQIDYEIRLSDPYRRIFNIGGGEVMPWQIRPGRWVFFSDFLTGRPIDVSNLYEDPRTLFIEDVTFDLGTEYAYQLNGGKVSRLDQKLAQLGLEGIAA